MKKDSQVDDLFARRESVPLTPENARFSRSEGGLISLSLRHEDGSVERFERVIVIRAFPISDPEEYIAVREPDRKNREKGDEIGMIRTLSAFDDDTVALIREELSLRYFVPQITKIVALKEKFGYTYFDVETTSGPYQFAVSGVVNNVRTLEDGRVLIRDIDGNCFVIPDTEKLDKQSMRKVEIYL